MRFPNYSQYRTYDPIETAGKDAKSNYPECIQIPRQFSGRCAISHVCRGGSGRTGRSRIVDYNFFLLKTANLFTTFGTNDTVPIDLFSAVRTIHFANRSATIRACCSFIRNFLATFCAVNKRHFGFLPHLHNYFEAIASDKIVA